MRIQKKDVKDILPLTSMQEGMLLHYLTKEKTQYLEHLVIHTKGRIDADIFRDCWNQIVESHDVLRSIFKWKKIEKPVQVILYKKPPKILVYEPEQTKEEWEKELEQRIKEDGIQLDEAPFYLVLCQYGEECSFHIVFHHILMDGWSIGILLKQFISLYQSGLKGEVLKVEKYGNFKDYVVMQSKQHLDEKEKDYWRKALKNYQVKNAVRPLHKRNKDSSYEKIERNLPDGLYKAMETFCQSAKVTLANLFYAAWGFMMESFIHDTDLVLGTTVSGRNAEIPEIENTVGLFINTIPLRIQPDKVQSAKELVLSVQKACNERQKYEFTSLSAIGQYTGIQASELFDTIIVIENYPLQIEEPEQPGDKSFTITGFEMEEYTSYPLTVIVDARNQYQMKLLYDTERYESYVIESMLESFMELLKDMTKNPQKSVKDLNLLSSRAKEQIVKEFNHTVTEYPREESIVSLFKQSVEKNPNKTALVYEDKTITYQELDEQSDILAALLIQAGNKKEQCVGLMCNRKPEMIVGMLGILKAHGAYVPISPEYPTERKEFILKDIKADMLVCNCGYIPASDVKVIDIRKKLVCEDAKKYLYHVEKIAPSQLAYLIYTSGSTGNPKGIMIEHRGVVRLVRNTNYVTFTPEDKILPTCPLEFDVSNFEIWGTLLNGAEAFLLDKEKMLSPQVLKQFIKENGISLMWMTTPLFNQMAQVDPAMFETLRYLIVGGDALSPYHIARVRKQCKELTLVNGYGPTENTVFSTAFQIESDYESRVPIGSPIANSTAYIMDCYGKMAPIGAVGELCTGLDGVARGYNGNQELTKEKFVPDIVDSERIMYRTGDLARFLPNGVIDFFGRMDYQVKVRGFRIELTEIEGVLNGYGGVKDCAVTVSDRGEYDKQLIAFIQKESEIDLDALKQYMKERVPVYCVPSRFVLLDKLPITVNGKIDRKALKRMESQEQAEATFITEETETEKKIQKIWEKILKKPATGLDVNFFEMGGTSLHMIQMANEIQKELGKNVIVVDLFTYTTIRSLSSYLDGETQNEVQEVVVQKTEERSEDIAVIGMSGRFPGAKTLERFYENIKDGRECISFFTREELEDVVPANQLENEHYVKAKGVLEESEYYDAFMFGYSDREAQLMDPQLRVLHECIFHTLEDAGYMNEKVKNTGLFIGASPNFEWLMRVHSDATDGTAAWEAANLNFHSLAAPIAYKLNLQGPVMMDSTACSSSLVSVHLACCSLLAGECEMAIAGGVSISLPLKNGYMYQDGMIKSPDGRCRPFREDSNGTVSGDGVGAVLLKPLSKAIEDKDYIYAVIKGSAVNNDGNRKAGFTAPSVEGQCNAIRSALKAAHTDGKNVRYIETHGTGTPIGDAIELRALQDTYGKEKEVKAALGSVKASIGHLDCAAGIAGFIKTALCLKNGVIPPCVHKGTPNKLLVNNPSFYLNEKLKVWEEEGKVYQAEGKVYQAGISSFGIGGTNVHMILEEPPVRKEEEGTQDKWKIVPFSAASKEALLEQFMAFTPLEKINTVSLQNISYGMQTGRKHRKIRKAFTVASKQELVEQLKKTVHIQAESEEKRPVVFLFPGQGTQYFGVCKELYEHTKVYREVFDECVAKITPEYELVKDYLLGQAGTNIEPESMDQTKNAQPLLFVLEYTLAKTLEKLGVQPSAMLGHSLGEYTAAAVSGVISFKDCFKLVVSRAKLMQKMETGAMVSVALAEPEIHNLLGGQVSYDIAAINAEEQVVISGSKPDMEQAKEILKKHNAAFVSLYVSHAFHSRMMEPMLEEFRKELDKVAWKEPDIPYLSNYTGEYITKEAAGNTEYYLKHLRNSVQFEKGAKKLLEMEDALFIEVGAGDVLSKLIMRNAGRGKGKDAVSMLPGAKKQKDGSYVFAQAIAWLWEKGLRINWDMLYGGQQQNKHPLPGYCFDQKKYWKYGNMAYHSVSEEKAGTKQELMLYEPVWTTVKLEEQHVATEQDFIMVADYENTDIATLEKKNVIFLLPEHAKQGRWAVNEESILTQLEEESCKAAEQLMKLITVLKKLHDMEKEREVKILFVGNGIEKVLDEDSQNPVLSMIKGIVRTVGEEYKNFLVGCLDMERNSASLDTQTIIDGFSIWEKEPVTNQFLAFRNGQYKALQYKQKIQKPVLSENQNLKFHGVYLITGGLGGIGLVIARHLVTVYEAAVILLTHSEFPERGSWKDWIGCHSEDDKVTQKIKEIQLLEELGGKIRIQKARLSDALEVKNVLEAINSEFGELSGVFHAAGTGDQTFIDFMTKDHLNEILEPKVQGTITMYQQLEKSSLKPGFLVLFSSITSITGGIGQIAYACANCFLDSFAELKRDSEIPVISINWDTWKETGMAVRALKDLKKQEVETDWEEAEGCYISKKKVPSATKRIYRIRLNREDRWFLQEHTVDGVSLLPGTAYLDMVYECLCDFLGVKKVKLEEFLIQKALAVETEQELYVVLEKKDENTVIQIMKEEMEGAVVYATGTAVPLEKDVRSESVDVDTFLPVSERNFLECDTIKTSKARISYGARWKCIDGIYYSQDRKKAMCVVTMKEQYELDLQQYRIHPALLDTALGFILKIQEQEKNYMPFGYQNLCIFGALEPKLSCIAETKKLQNENELLPVECTVMNQKQEVLLHIGQFLVRESDAQMVNTAEEESQNQKLRIHKTGDLDSLYWKVCERTALAEDEVEIVVCATGMNFKEVLYALGMLGDSFSGLEFGLECAGIVIAKGEKVTKWNVGDAVMGMVTSGYNRYVTAREDILMRVPDNMTLKQAATVPIAFITAYYALVVKGQIKENSRILIHLATGGVGQAAVQIGKHIGAELYVTAGSEEKRNYLRQSGMEHVYNSRTLEFAEQIPAKLDVVLNSIAGEAKVKGMSLLRKHGSFLELGIRSEQEDQDLRRMIFENAISYCAISTDYEIPEYADILRQIEIGLKEGYYKPLPYHSFEITEISNAFSYMAASKHIGKVVICHEALKKYEKSRKKNQNVLGTHGIRTKEGITLLFKQIEGIGHSRKNRLIVSDGELFSQNALQNQMLEQLSADGTGEKKQRPALKNEYEKPVTVQEKELVRILEEFTGISPIGRKDNFFELGITSLDIIQINNKVNKIYPKEPSIVKLYTYPTCFDLAAYLSGNERTEEKQEEFKKNQKELKAGRKKTVDIINRRRRKS